MSIIQDVFSICTIEEQYLSTSHACKEEIGLKWFLGEFGRIPNKVKVLCGSQISIYLPKNPAYQNKTKNIYVKYHFVRHVIDEDGVLLEKVHTQKNRADMFKKPVTLEKLRWCIASLGLQKR